MANARKLPSGAWRTQASKNIDGARIKKSFTVHPDQTGGNSKKAKALSEMQAREWQLSNHSEDVYGKTVKQVMESYISDRSKILSPSTLTDYRRYVPMFKSLWAIYISDIESSHIQRIINEWSVYLTSKTIKNRISFLLSALDYAECDKKFRLRFPQSTSKVVTSPDLEDVQMLIEASPDDFKPVLYLAAFGGLRRGEISALRQEDISRDMNTIFIHADFVRDDNKWVYKPFPKNGLSGTVDLPKFVIDALPESEGFVFDMNPAKISRRYLKIQKMTGLPFNFHSLRHFAASFRSDAGIPKKYIEEVGRWKNGSSVLDRVYDNTLTSTRKKYTKIANDYIEEHFNPERKIN